MAVIGHHSAEVARRGAGELIEAWESLNHDPAHHHPVTNNCMNNDDFLAALTRVRDGAAREDEPALLVWCALWRFLPVTERTDEANFSRVHMASVFRRITAAYASLHLRLPQWEHDVEGDADGFDSLLKHVHYVRTRVHFPEVLGLAGEPQIAHELASIKLNASSSTHGLFTRTRELMYSQEIQEQHKSMRAAKAVNKKKKESEHGLQS